MRLQRGRHPRRRRQCHSRRQWVHSRAAFAFGPHRRCGLLRDVPAGLPPTACKWHNHLLILHIMTCSIDGVGRIRIETPRYYVVRNVMQAQSFVRRS